MRGISIRDRMIRLSECDPHMRAGRSRDGFLRRGRARRAAARRASRHAAGIATHAAHDAALERQHRAAAERDEQAAALDEVLDLGEALPADAAGDVVGRGGRADARRLRASS